MENQFIREKETNVANIITEDVSTTDGDQIERSWSVAYDNNNDGSFDGEAYAPLKLNAKDI